MPMPVSRTEKVSSWNAASSSRQRAVTESTTSPRSVNLTAFESRFNRIWRKRVTSPAMPAGVSSPIRYARSMPFSAARVATRSSALSTHSRTSNGCDSSSSLPASILEKSRMSLMTVRSASPLWRTTSAYSRCSSLSSVLSRSPLIPITAFIGVRISWLIVARNALLASLACSASRRAWSNSVMS